MIYSVFSNEKEANDIIEVLLKEKLIACANVFPKVTSMYMWNDKIEKNQEAIAILKTLETKTHALELRMKALHSYEVPCIVQLPSVKANNEYLQWIESSLA